MIDLYFLIEYFVISCVCFNNNIIYNYERKGLRSTHTYAHIYINEHINSNFLLIPIEC